MSRIERISSNIALKLKNENNFDDEKYEVIKYGLHAFFQMTFSILVVIIVGTFFKVGFEAFLVSLTISILRRSSGGVHASTELNCAIIGTLFSVIPALIIDKIELKFIYYILIISVFMIISIILVFKLSPVDTPNKPIKTEKKKKRLKKASLITVVIYIIITFICCLLYEFFKFETLINIGLLISFGCLWQSYTLTKSCNKLYKIIDSFLINLFKMGRDNK